jgi:hypothetical protein
MRSPLFERNLRAAKRRWGPSLGRIAVKSLKGLSEELRLEISFGDILLLDNHWYVTHTGLLRIARRRRCLGINVETVPALCDPPASRYVCKATVYISKSCSGFAGLGDADPSNVSYLVHGAEMRVAETRAVNRALRKAYGIGICSIEEIGPFTSPPHSSQEPKKLAPQPANGNYRAPKVRDRLCQLIRQHQLDPNLVKAYATDFCGVTALRDATREQVENFINYLAAWAVKDRDALLCQLNSYPSQKEGVA